MSLFDIVFAWKVKGNDYTKTVAIDSEAPIELDTTVEIGTDVQKNLACIAADIEGIKIYCDQDVTIHTNATDATGGNTIVVTAGVPIFWYPGCGYACFITEDINTIYVDNASAAIANLIIVIDQAA